MSNLQVFVKIPGGHEDEVSLTEAKLGKNVSDLGTALTVIQRPWGLHGGVARARQSWNKGEFINEMSLEVLPCLYPTWAESGLKPEL